MTVNDFITLLIASILIIMVIIIEIIANKKFEQKMKCIVDESTNSQENPYKVNDSNNQLTKKVDQKRENNESL